MRNLILAAFAASGLMALAAPANAVGTRHPFCIQGQEFPGLSNCTYDTYQACQATASGRMLNCIANPYFVGVSDDARATPYPRRGRHVRARPTPPRDEASPYSPIHNFFTLEED